MNESRTQVLTMSWSSRGFLRFKGCCLILVLSCIVISQAVCVPCPTRNHLLSYVYGIQDPLDYNTCQSCGDIDTSLRNLRVDGTSTTYVKENSPGCSAVNDICINPNSFCFLSALPEEENCKAANFNEVAEDSDGPTPFGFLHNHGDDNSSIWSRDNASFRLSNGNIIRCFLNSAQQSREESTVQIENVDHIGLISFKGPSLPSYDPQELSRASALEENSEGVEPGHLDNDSSSPYVEISPPFLDWGPNYLYSPSFALLTVANTCNSSILYVYEPFSTDPQFYAYDFHDMSLEPGETASIAFVFLPRWLGSSLARLVLQTSRGGFLIHAKGLAIESPYGIQPLVGLDVSSDGRLLKNLSLCNPFDDTLYVEELTTWILVSAESTPYSAHAVCRSGDAFQASDEFSSFVNVKDWLKIESAQLGLPLLGIRPYSQWKVDPHSTETIIEIDLLSHMEGKVLGAFCLGLSNSSRDRIDTVIVPLEAQVNHGKKAKAAHTGLVSVFLEPLVEDDSKGSIYVAISVRNGGLSLLSVVKIGEVTEGSKFFHIKYMQGLIVFPGTITRIALVIYTPAVDSQDSALDIQNRDCKLHVVTNDSTSPIIEIPCQDLLHTFSKYQHPSAPASTESSYIGSVFQTENGKPGNTRTGFLGSMDQPSLPVKLRVSELVKADEFMLRNWRSQGTVGSMSVLEDAELLYPTVQVGMQWSKWITVRNPSQKPVIMQVILNSGVIVGQCKDSEDESMKQQHFLLGGLVHGDNDDQDAAAAADGFSIAETALTEANVIPHGSALFGPIIFRPSKRCTWRSSVLIRNNLSGVEWVPLQGSGGSLSLSLLEGSEHIYALKFNFNMPIAPLNISPPELLQGDGAACVRPLFKEVYAKNTGDVLLEVRRIEVSGTGCGSDGFMIHTCRGFALEPGESTRLLISYQTDFSASVVQRDLELALSTGVLVIPMTASLPAYMLRFCRKSFIWMVVRKLSLVVLVAAALTLMVFCRILPRGSPVSDGEEDCLMKTCEKKCIAATVSSTAEIPARLHRNPRKSRSVTRHYDNSSELGLPMARGGPGHHDADGEPESMKWMEEKHGSFFAASYHHMRNPLLPSSVVETKARTVAESFGLSEEPLPRTGNLTVKIERERGRRRKKRVPNAGLTGKFVEVSSSQSGNSTPSSPVSPLTPLMPLSKRTWPSLRTPNVDHAVKSPEYPFVGTAADRDRDKEQQVTNAATVERLPLDSQALVAKRCCDSNWLFSSAHGQGPAEPRKMGGRPLLMPSATFPSSGWREASAMESLDMGSTSAIALQSRAPGPKLGKEKKERGEEEKRGALLGEEFTYDIWGNHFAEFRLMGSSSNSSNSNNSRARDPSANSKVLFPAALQGDSSQSFFARAPQSHLQKAPARSLSPK